MLYCCHQEQWQTFGRSNVLQWQTFGRSNVLQWQTFGRRNVLQWQTFGCVRIKLGDVDTACLRVSVWSLC
jgi:hypothetical protein